MSSTLRFIVTVTLAWAIFFVWLVIAAHAAPVHGCSCTPAVAVAALVVTGASIGGCLGFLCTFFNADGGGP